MLVSRESSALKGAEFQKETEKGEEGSRRLSGCGGGKSGGWWEIRGNVERDGVCVCGGTGVAGWGCREGCLFRCSNIHTVTGIHPLSIDMNAAAAPLLLSLSHFPPFFFLRLGLLPLPPLRWRPAPLL